MTLCFKCQFARTNIQAKENFNEDIVSLRLDSLNKLTPINLAYNKTVGQYIKFYLQQRPEQVSKLLTLSDYYFPVFEEYLDKNSMPLELKYLPIIESALNPKMQNSLPELWVCGNLCITLPKNMACE